MENRTKFIVASGAVILLAFGAVTFAVVSSEPEPVNPANSAPVAKTDYKITDADKSEIKLVTDAFIGSAGTYGWSPDVIKDQTNLNLAMTSGDTFSVFDQLTHSTSDDAARQLNKLSDSNRYSNSVNTMIFSTPFAVTSELTGELTYPEEVFQLNGYPTIEVTAPLKTNLTYVVQDYNYRDDQGNLVTGGIRYETMVFEGNVSMTLALKPEGWILDSFNQNTGVFVTDKTFTFSNGQFESTEATPVSYTVQAVNEDGTLGEPVDNLERFKAVMDGTYDPAVGEDGAAN